MRAQSHGCWFGAGGGVGGCASGGWCLLVFENAQSAAIGTCKLLLLQPPPCIAAAAAAALTAVRGVTSTTRRRGRCWSGLCSRFGCGE